MLDRDSSNEAPPKFTFSNSMVDVSGLRRPRCFSRCGLRDSRTSALLRAVVFENCCSWHHVTHVSVAEGGWPVQRGADRQELGSGSERGAPFERFQLRSEHPTSR